MCAGGCFGSSTNKYMPSYNAGFKKPPVDNSVCGITAERIMAIDFKVTDLYSRTREQYLLVINAELVRMRDLVSRVDLCGELSKIEAWEATYGD